MKARTLIWTLFLSTTLWAHGVHSTSLGRDETQDYAETYPLVASKIGDSGLALQAPHTLHVDEAVDGVIKLDGKGVKFAEYEFYSKANSLELVTAYPFSVGGVALKLAVPSKDVDRLRTSFAKFQVGLFSSGPNPLSTSQKAVTIEQLAFQRSITLDRSIGKVDLYAGIRRETTMKDGSTRTFLTHILFAFGATKKTLFQVTIVVSPMWIVALSRENSKLDSQQASQLILIRGLRSIRLT